MLRSEGRSHNAAPETPLPPVPSPPNPSTDAGISSVLSSRGEITTLDSAALSNTDNHDIFSLEPTDALKMLCRFTATLANVTGDVPPTPPITQFSNSNMDVVWLEKEKCGSRPEPNCKTHDTSTSDEDDDGVPTKAKTPIGSPEAHPTEHLPVIGANMAPADIQHGAIARKFYSKKPPPIDLEEYLLRLHRFCPTSTAVYLATSLYIYRLSVVEKSLSVTPRNVHRLVLAGIRVAMKALEDQIYPHRRFAKVGGVSELELGRLEVSFCFITEFELMVTEEVLSEHCNVMRAEVTS